MHPILRQFIEILQTENRYDALVFIKGILERREMTFYEVYEELLGPSLNHMPSSGDESLDIWREHVRTSIIRTIVENCFHEVVQARREWKATPNKSVVILTPPEEYHSLGARMVKDLFTYLGFQAIFVGGNTPFRVLEAGLIENKVDYVAISISNPYHLVSARNMIQRIRQSQPIIKIIVGGNAIAHLGERVSDLQADYVMTSFLDLTTLERGDTDEASL